MTESIRLHCLSYWQEELNTLLTSIEGEEKIFLCLKKIKTIDISSLYIVYRTLQTWISKNDLTVDISELPRGLQKEWRAFETLRITCPEKVQAPEFFHLIGRKFLNVVDLSEVILSFFGYLLVKTVRIFRKNAFFPMDALFVQIQRTGLNAIPIIGLISFLIGMVLSYQGINQLSRFGASIYAIDFLAIGVFREIGPLLTAIVVAGRSASSFTAHLGTMVVNQEIDAMKIFRLDPVLYLVLPRILALLIVLPLLVFISDIFSLLGGMLTTRLVMDMRVFQFIQQFKGAMTPATFWVGVSKAPLFAFLIGMIGCFRGLRVQKSAQSVGEMTTKAVVESIFLVIVSNALISILYSYLKV